MAEPKQSRRRRKALIALTAGLIAAALGFFVAVKFPGTHHEGDGGVASIVAAFGGAVAAISAAAQSRRRARERKNG